MGVFNEILLDVVESAASTSQSVVACHEEHDNENRSDSVVNIK